LIVLNKIKKVFGKIDKSLAVRCLACGLVVSMACSLCTFNSHYNNIKENVLRLHVLANSDSQKDQDLKLKVRDALLLASNEVFSDCKTSYEAMSVAKQNIKTFTDIAQKTVLENGYDYSVRVEIADTFFENRQYDDFTLPAGNYEALRVLIGSGEGKNWWCVMFPAVCLPAASERDSISCVLDDTETDMVKAPSRYVARFKVVEIYEKLRNKFSKYF
jgi:stage II sporulation protein R